MAKNFTEKQKKFLATLVETGNYQAAKKAAGYHVGTPYADIVGGEEFSAAVKHALNEYMVLHAPQAVHSLIHLMNNPAEIGGAVMRGCATDILDRVGLSKQDSLEVTVKQPDGIVLIPAKKPIDHEALLKEQE